MKHKTKKHLKNHLNKTLSLLEKHGAVSVPAPSPSVIPFIFDSLNFKKVLVLKGPGFHDILSSFEASLRGVVAFPYIKSFEKGGHVVKSFSQDVFERSSVFFSCSPNSVFTCVVDERVLDKPALFNPKNKKILVGAKGCSRETLLEFLNKNKYTPVDSISSEGEYVIRGGVVDVFSFGRPFPFRVGFFDENQPIIFFNQSTGNIIKKQDFDYVYPCPEKNKITIKDAVSSFYKIYYINKRLVIKKPLERKKDIAESPDKITLVDQLFYKKNKERGSFLYSKKLLTEGCNINGSFYFPLWYNSSVVDFSDKQIPLSGSLKEGDYYVHEAFGVCKYLGVLSFDDGEKFSLKFLDGKISLDIRLLNKISFFAPGEAENIALNSLNKTGLWRKKRSKSTKEASLFAESLVKRYIKRESTLLSGFEVDKVFLSSFLGAFPYVDTRDQSFAWAQILKDLVSPKPMHRLLCGDVGFGKTELAIRASFVCALNSSKTLVLCPTTILSEQLYEAFAKRLSGFGVSVSHVSRLTTKNQKKFEAYVDGNTDVLIGTHSVLSQENVLKKSSLIVVDEEHRFGVKDKEKILLHSPGCNYLNMSATPIPRTLQLSVSGVRSISTLVSPPKERKPIITNVFYFEKNLLKTLLAEEMARGGQAYVVDNSVKNVKSLYLYIKKTFPFVAFLYGSLSKKEIKKTMQDFRSGSIKILVSTVIIESGIDIPSANTVVINNANMFGLSQLHQLRGRVGRSTSQSYAYLFIEKKDSVTADGIRRLKSIKKHTSLGSGYNLALEDLDIRGSGNLFGYSQSGKSSVGFELYSKLLATAIKKKEFAFYSQTEVEIGSSFISPSFIKNNGERSFYYKSIADCPSLEALKELLNKTETLFGKLPKSFLSLFLTKELSLLSEQTPVVKILKRNSFFCVWFSQEGVQSVPVFLEKINLFFNKKGLSFKFSAEAVLLKIQFEYVEEDYYILLKEFIKFLYV